MNQEQGQRGDAVAGGLVEGLLRALEAERERSKEAERQVRLLCDVSARLNLIRVFHVEFFVTNWFDILSCMLLLVQLEEVRLRLQPADPRANDALMHQPADGLQRKSSTEEAKAGKNAAKEVARRKSAARKTGVNELSSVSLASVSSYQESDNEEHSHTGTFTASDGASIQEVPRRGNGQAAVERTRYSSQDANGQAAGRHHHGRAKDGDAVHRRESSTKPQTRGKEATCQTEATDEIERQVSAPEEESEAPADHDGLDQTVAQMVNAVQVRNVSHLCLPLTRPTANRDGSAPSAL